MFLGRSSTIHCKPKLRVWSSKSRNIKAFPSLPQYRWLPTMKKPMEIAEQNIHQTASHILEAYLLRSGLPRWNSECRQQKQSPDSGKSPWEIKCRTLTDHNSHRRFRGFHRNREKVPFQCSMVALTRVPRKPTMPLAIQTLDQGLAQGAWIPGLPSSTQTAANSSTEIVEIVMLEMHAGFFRNVWTWQRPKKLTKLTKCVGEQDIIPTLRSLFS